MTERRAGTNFQAPLAVDHIYINKATKTLYCRQTPLKSIKINHRIKRETLEKKERKTELWEHIT